MSRKDPKGTPEGFVARYSPTTGVTTFSSPDWTDLELTPDYWVTFERIESHILSAFPRGMISWQGTLALFRAYDGFLAVSGLDQQPYVEISDYSGIVNMPSKKARVEVGEQLIQRIEKAGLTGHFVYNVPKYIKWLYNIGARLKSPGIPMLALDTYEQALVKALALKPGKPSLGRSFDRIKDRLQKASPYHRHTADLLDYISRINWDEQGFREDEIPANHPLKPVFNAIAVLKADYDRTHREREKIEQNYKRLFNHIADPVVVFDQKTKRFLDCNNAFLSVYGYTRDEVLSMTPEDLHRPEELARVKKNISDGRTGDTHHYTHLTKDGKVIDVAIRTDETDYQGRPAWISNIRDITEQNRLETELRRHRDTLESLVQDRTRALEQEIADRKQTETKFKTLFDSNADAVLLLDKKQFIDCNQAAMDLFGVASKEIFATLQPPDVSPRQQENGRPSKEMAGEKLSIAFEQGSNRFEWLHQNLRTRRIFPADVLLTHMTLDGKDVLQAVVRDITDRREAEEALRQSEEKYRGMIQNMQDVFYRTDMGQLITMISPSGLRLLGYAEESQVLGRPLGEVFFRNSAGFKRFMALMETEGRVKNFELDLFTRDETLVPVITSSKYHTDVMDTPQGIEGTITSIREQKEAEEALRLAKLQAEAAASAKSEFLANMSHEIRTPMNAILGMGELMLETRMDDYQKNLMGTINTEASALLEIINAILDFSKGEAGRLELEQTPFNLRGLLEDLSASFAVSAHRKDLEFISFLPPDAPEDLIGDPGRLRQVLVNLVGNAIKFTSQGEIFVWVDADPTDDSQVRLRFNVRDTGIGIPDEKQAYIFESFAQADGSFTRKYGGTGLGTTISKQLVEMMGGQIGLSSSPGKGSTFWFSLTFDRNPEQQLMPDTFDITDKIILVAAHNPRARMVLASHLDAWGCRVIEADSGTSFLEQIQENPKTAMALVDLELSDTDGFALVKKLRAGEIAPSLPVILLTALGKRGDNQRCRDLDIQGYLLKPVKQADLKTAISAILNQAGPAQPTPLTRHHVSDQTLKKVQVLLAEDYPANQQVAVRHLLNQGIQVSLAKDGQQAVDLFRAKQFNLVLMDIQMPVMDGYEATQAIRDHENRMAKVWEEAHPGEKAPFKPVPIIAMTAHAVAGFKETCLEKGMDDYMTKPLRKKHFIEMIHAHLSSRGQATVPDTQGRPPESPVLPTGPDCPMDLATALEEFDQDREFLADLLSQFLATVAAQMPAMDRAAADQDFSSLAAEAHAIKGGAANLCAPDLSRAAAAIEVISKERAGDKLTPAMDRLLFEYARLKEFSRLF